MAADAVYGFPPPGLAAPSPLAIQTSPLAPGSHALEALKDASLKRMVVAAPAGVLERRYVLAHALRAVGAKGRIVALAPKTRGGARLRAELEAFGCAVQETARRHHRICDASPPDVPAGLAEALERGALQIAPGLGLWSQPGVFSWDRLDPGSSLLIESLPPLAGSGADLGCGVGVLALAVLRHPEVSAINLIDIDRRATEAARRNVTDGRARIFHRDARLTDGSLTGLDFVVMNPPFHAAGMEDRGLGLALVGAAAAMLKGGGVLRMVSNLALSYEPTLISYFRSVRVAAQRGGYRIYEAVK
jgi:16S rRNA (guanine1207-N2)-methyltransferase